MWATITKPFAWLMVKLYELTGNYGVAVILFALAVNLILTPFMAKSKKSMMRSTRLQPRIQELQKRHEGNSQKLNAEMQKLYREEGVNPMSGCLWSLIPFPILIALYSVIRQPLTRMMFVSSEFVTTLQDYFVSTGLYEIPAKANAYYEIVLAELTHTHWDAVQADLAGKIDPNLLNLDFGFLGLNLGSQPKWNFFVGMDWSDAAVWLPALGLFLIPFISAGLTILQTTLSQKMNPPQDAQTAQTSKTMNLVMPLMSIYICFIMPVSMGLYWIEQSVLGIIQEAILNRYYKTKLDAEMAEFNEAQRTKDAEMEAKRAETERLKAEGKTQVNANTSKKRLAAQERNAEEQRLAAIRAAERAAKNPGAELPASQVGTRRFARGRAYVADRYAVTEAEAAAETAEAAAAGEADLEEAKAQLAETEAVETVETVETAEETAEAPAAEEKE